MPGSPLFNLAGAANNGTTAVTVAWPATHATNDVALLCIQTDGESATLSTAAGFVRVTGSPQTTGTAGATNAVYLDVFWCRATSSAQPNPVVADAGDHVQGVILTFTNCATSGNPWDLAAGNVVAAATTTVNMASPGTITQTDELVVGILAGSVDTNTSQATGWANSALTSVAEIVDVYTTTGGGGGISAAAGKLKLKATCGAITATLANASKQAYLVLTLVSDPISGTGSLAVANPSLVATGIRGNISTGSIAVAKPALVATGTQALNASGGLAIGTPTMSGSGTNTAPGGGGVLARDTFATGSDGSLSTSHTADTGQSWVVASGQVDLTFSGTGQFVYAGGAAECRDVLVVTPPSPDYSIEADIGFTDATPSSQGISVRALSTEETGYLLTNDVSGDPGNVIWQLYVGVAGSYTQLGTYTTARPSSAHAKLKAVGTSITATIDGTDRIAVVDGTITAAGDPALRCTSAGIDAGRNISNLTVTDERVGAGLTGTGSVAVGSPALTGAGHQTQTGTGTLTVTASPAGTGIRGLLGTGSLAVQNPTLTSSGHQTETGSGSLAGIVNFAGTGKQTEEGTGSLVGTVNLSGIGIGGIRASSASLAVVPVFSGTGTSGTSITGTGSLSVVISYSGSGHQSESGTGSLAVSVSLSGAGHQTESGTGSLAGAVNLVASGHQTETGSGSLGLQAVFGASGTTTPAGTSGSGSLALRATLAATGFETETGTGSLTVSVPSFNGSGRQTQSGSGGLAVSIVESGEGSQPITGTGSLRIVPVLLGVDRLHFAVPGDFVAPPLRSVLSAPKFASSLTVRFASPPLSVPVFAATLRVPSLALDVAEPDFEAELDLVHA